jgi:hypothetical protein
MKYPDHWYDLALDVAKQFTLDSQPRARDRMQAAVLHAMGQVNPRMVKAVAEPAPQPEPEPEVLPKTPIPEIDTVWVWKQNPDSAVTVTEVVAAIPGKSPTMIRYRNVLREFYNREIDTFHKLMRPA